MYRTVAALLAASGVGLCVATPVFSQATQTWISGVGDDVNPCSRTAPCKTFPGAISKTAVNGEIDALDPGGFGAVTVTKTIVLDGGGGQVASILVTGTNGITINAPASAVVILRNLRIEAVGGGVDGVRIVSAGLVVLDNVEIAGSFQNAVEFGPANNPNCAVIIHNSRFQGGLAGLKLTLGTPTASLDHVSIRGAARGIDAVVGTVDVKDSYIAQSSGFGVYAEGGTIDLDNVLFTGNAVAVQSQAGSTVRINNSDLVDNLAGFGCGGGTIASGQNNRKAANSGGVGTVCAPNSTIAVQ
jgi:hypothetical protein